MTRVIYFSSKKKQKVKKSTKRLFTFLHVVFALDFGYLRSSSSRVNFIIKIVTFLYCLIFFGVSSIYFLENTRDLFTFAWMISLCLQYFFNSNFLLFYGDVNSFKSLQETLKSVDVKLSINTDLYGLDKKIITTSLLNIVLKSTLNSVFCFIDDNSECVVSIFGISFTLIQMMSVDMILVMSFFVFYSVYCRLQVLNEFVKNTDQISIGLEIYKTMVDAIEKPKKYIDYLYTSALLIRTPDLILTTYLGLLKAKDYSVMEEDHQQAVRYLYTLHMFCLTCAPAVCAGAVASAARRTHLILHDKILLERNSSKEETIQMFIDYTRARPMKFSMFGLIPLDWSLPIIILNLCISYQIVIVQFTKLY